MDIPKGVWYEESIGKAVQMGITDLKGRMQPTRTVTREEVFTTLAKAFKLKTVGDDYTALDILTELSSPRQVLRERSSQQ